METTQPRPKARKSIPKGASLLIRLDDMERERRILVPGHRFEPLRPLKKQPSELVLLGPKFAPIPTRTIVIPLDELFRFHSILDQDLMFSLFMEASSGNVDVLTSNSPGSDNKVIRMQVYNLDPLFGKKAIPENTYLRVTLETLSPTVFTISVLDPTDSSLAGRDAWFDALDVAFGRAMDELVYPTSNAKLLSLAYRYGGKAVYGNPAASFSEYLNSKRSIDFMDFAGGTVIWRRGAKVEDLHFPEPVDTGGKGDGKPKATRRGQSGRMAVANKLDRFFDDYAFAFNSDELTAFLLDMVYREKTLQDVWDRFFETAPHWDANPDAAEELSKLIVEYVEHALAGYNPGDDVYGDLRGQLVDLYEDYVVWMRELEGMVESTNDLPVAEFTELAQLVGHLNQLMVMLNPSARREPVSDAEIDSLYATIEQTAPIILDLERRVVDRIKKRKKGKGQ